VLPPGLNGFPRLAVPEDLLELSSWSIYPELSDLLVLLVGGGADLSAVLLVVVCLEWMRNPELSDDDEEEEEDLRLNLEDAACMGLAATAAGD